jgi:hypothetical protein
MGTMGICPGVRQAKEPHTKSLPSHTKYLSILRQYSVSKSYPLQLFVTKLYRECVPSSCNVITI